MAAWREVLRQGVFSRRNNRAVCLLLAKGNSVVPKLRCMSTMNISCCYLRPAPQKYQSFSSRSFPLQSYLGCWSAACSSIASKGLSHLSLYGPILALNRTLACGTTRTIIGAGTITTRNITKCSKLGKRKTCKAVAKRFLRTGKGKLKRWRAGKHHNMMKKRNKRRRQLRKPTYVSKQQLKLLNKMLNGW